MEVGKIRIGVYPAALVVIGILYTAIVLHQVAPYNGLPSPIFGGDYYHQLGYIYSMYERPALEWFRAGAIDGALPAYYPLYGILVTVFGKLGGLDPLHAILDFNLFLPLASLAMFFIFIRELLDSDKLALIGSLAIVSFTDFPILKYQEFASLVMVPLFLYALLLLFKQRTLKRAAFLGLVYGAMGLVHSTSFMYSSVMIVALFAFLLFERRKAPVEGAREMAPLFALSFGLGFLISLIMWFGPIFVYHGHAALGSNIWSLPDVRMPAAAMNQLFSGLSSMFFDMSSLLRLLVSLLSLAGLVSLAAGWKSRKDDASRFIGFAFAVSFAFVYSYFLTSPLLDTHFIPTISQHLYLDRVAVLLALLFIKERVEPDKTYGVLFDGAFALVFIISALMAYPGWSVNQWNAAAEAPQNPLFSGLQSYLLANTSVNDVILTNNEMSFAIFAMSGREVMVSRRAQNDPFIDFDQRELDSARILYGNDTKEKLALLRQYKVKYVYYDLNWANLEYSFDSQGQLTNYFDPPLVLTTPEHTAALQADNISAFQIYAYIDPSVRDQYTRRYNITLVSPANYDFSGKGIWKDDLDPYLTKVWEFDDSGQQVAALYRVDLPS